MNSLFIIPLISLFNFFGSQDNDAILTELQSSNQSWTNQNAIDSSEYYHFINASSLKHLPLVIKDLNAALNKSKFKDGDFLNGLGFVIYLFDVDCKSFKTSAAVQKISDTIYHVKLNRYNSRATDKALAVTLIHETMHCVLLDLYTRARLGDNKAAASILNFGLPRNDTSNLYNNDFFALMNSGEPGQHELIHQLFYPQMVALLKDFESIHNRAFSDHYKAEYLMWSGLQFTNGFKKLRDEEKEDIELTIRRAKGIATDPD